ncbi:sporulation inhibitor of replication protein SirA [Priestia koreensis]|uniref:Sporulation inhibitor of replication protein SirA n=1 Tax=Priestia koreensis TaxID=284581 RepID=A0A0M0L5Q7_9BACI|nr:sporulation inhibitor of replication protein SirA [Priestia koreensis]KOO46420.1 hypothetical protein AMD01_11360 [Priestia koreensis]
MMRKYDIYLIEKEVANHYYQRAGLIFQLFKDFQQPSHIQYDELKKQVEYITKPLPIEELEDAIESAFLHTTAFFKGEKQYKLSILKTQSRARIKMYDRLISLEGIGGVDAETAFFEVLRKLNPYFLAMDFTKEQYGWLTPIKTKKFI